MCWKVELALLFNIRKKKNKKKTISGFWVYGVSEHILFLSKPRLYAACIFLPSTTPKDFRIFWQNCLVSTFDLCTIIDPLNR